MWWGESQVETKKVLEVVKKDCKGDEDEDEEKGREKGGRPTFQILPPSPLFLYFCTLASPSTLLPVLLPFLVFLYTPVFLFLLLSVALFSPCRSTVRSTAQQANSHIPILIAKQ